MLRGQAQRCRHSGCARLDLRVHDQHDRNSARMRPAAESTRECSGIVDHQHGRLEAIERLHDRARMRDQAIPRLLRRWQPRYDHDRRAGDAVDLCRRTGNHQCVPQSVRLGELCLRVQVSPNASGLRRVPLCHVDDVHRLHHSRFDRAPTAVRGVLGTALKLCIVAAKQVEDIVPRWSRNHRCPSSSAHRLT